MRFKLPRGAATTLSRLSRLGLCIKRVPVVPSLPLGLLVAFATIAVAAPLLAPHNPVQEQLRESLIPPMWMAGGSRDFALGTDAYGRDVLSRLMFGARISLSIAVLAIFIGGVVGTILGLIAGFIGSWVDAIIMRIVDIMLSFPIILVALALAVGVGPSFSNVVLVISLLIWPPMARQIRGEVLVIRRRDFVDYARIIGVRSWVIVLRHVLPNIMPTLLVVSSLQVGHVILLEAALSFLGAGVPPPAPSWGVMVSDGTGLLASGWWISLFPGVAIVLTVMAFNMLGDWLRDHWDPSLQAR